MYSEQHELKCNLTGLNKEFNSSFCMADLRGSESNFSARFRGTKIGSLAVYRFDMRGLKGGIRSMRHIRDNPTDDFIVLLPQNFSHRVMQFSNCGNVKAGSFTLVSTLKPFESYFDEPQQHYFSQLVVKVPGPLLRKEIPLIDQCCGMPFPAQEVVGEVMTSMIKSILEGGNHLPPVQADGLGAILFDTMRLVVQDSPVHASLSDSMKQDAHGKVRQEAQRFIECHLSDPRLTIATIAEHCGVSAGHLHSLFSNSPTTIGGLVRELRLLRCREDLRNPALRNQSIIQIAMRWGYVSSAHFTRAYRSRFGVSPIEERNSVFRQY